MGPACEGTGVSFSPRTGYGNSHLDISRPWETRSPAVLSVMDGVMVASCGEGTRTVALEEVAGNKKLVPADHPWVEAARSVGTCLGLG
jgi:hypothetical protein